VGNVENVINVGNVEIKKEGCIGELCDNVII
jgi:hypothetical protein